VLLVLLALACVATVPLRGRSLSGLLELRLRAVWLVPGALLVQVGITTVFPGGDHGLHALLHLVSYGLAAAFVIANLRVPGIPVIAAGGVLNVIAIAANGGTMPASRSAMRVAGLRPGAGFANSGAVAHPHLAALGDVIPVPGPHPLANVLSAGDLLIYAGVLVLLHRLCRSEASAAGPGPAGNLADA
jgi:hypothetical protein